MKTAQELRQALKELFEQKNESLQMDAESLAPQDLQGDALAAYNKVSGDLEELIRDTLKSDTLSREPDSNFYPSLVQVMTARLYLAYDGYDVAPNLTDEQILAHRDDIVNGNVDALEDLRQKPAEKRVAASYSRGNFKREQLYNNLAYYFYMMAHLAKHFGSREAAQKYLRASSIARSAVIWLPMNSSDDSINELVMLAEDALDELKVASDYYALKDWETFRAVEAEKIAAENAHLSDEAKGQEAK